MTLELGYKLLLVYLLSQVFLLDSQVNNSSNLKQDTRGPANEEDDQRSYVFVLSSVENKEKPENAERWVTCVLLGNSDLPSLLSWGSLVQMTISFVADYTSKMLLRPCNKLKN